MNGEERPRKLGPCPYCGKDETRRLDGAVLSGVVPALLDPRCLISFGRYFFEWKSLPRAYEPTGLVGVRAIAVGRQVWARGITVYSLFLIHHKSKQAKASKRKQFQISDFRFHISYFIFMISDFRFSYFIFQNSDFRIPGIRFRISDFIFLISDFHISDFRIQIAGFRFSGPGGTGLPRLGEPLAVAGGTRPGHR